MWERPQLCKLKPEIAQHAAGDLVLIVESVELEHLTDRLALLLGDTAEVLADLRDGGIVDIKTKSKLAKVLCHGL